MTVETFQQPSTAVAVATPPTGGALTGYLVDYQDASRLMEMTLDTPWVPDAFRPQAFLPKNERPTPQAVEKARQTAVAAGAVAIVYGRSIGFEDPFSALQNVYVVGGRPGLYAAAMVAIVQAAGHDIWTEDISDARAVVCGRRRGVEQAERVAVTMDQARKAGWTRNQKYNTEPQAMLWARAASTVCRRIAQDALKGMTRSVEELHDDEATVTAVATRTVQRAVPAARPALASPQAPVRAETSAPAPQAARPAPAASLPPLPGEDVTAPQEQEQEAAPQRAPVSDAQLRKLGVLFGQLGVKGSGERAARLAIASAVAGRQLESSRDLSVSEATVLIDTLEADGARVVAKVLGTDEITDPAASTVRNEPFGGDGIPMQGNVQAGPPLPGEEDPYDDYDPSLEMDGAEAAAEGL